MEKLIIAIRNIDDAKILYENLLLKPNTNFIFPTKVRISSNSIVGLSLLISFF
jgi:hypothetical protein